MANPKLASDPDEQQEPEKWYERTRYQILLFAVGIAIFVTVGALVLDWYIDPENSTQKKDLVQALGLITAGVAGAVGIFFTWRGQGLAREAQEHNQENTLTQLRNAQEQLRLARQSQDDNQKNTQEQLEQSRTELDITRQGQITERFTRAIDQLGSEKLEIRLGGIYSLERIDKESPERAYHGTVMEVLTAYVRENSRREAEAPSITSTTSNEGVEQDTEVAQKQDAQPTVQKFPTDVQTILDILKRREEEDVPEEHHVLLDLRVADLRRANLQVTDLEGAHLGGADLREANLTGTTLRGAILREADLRRANLQVTDLRRADLEGADLEGADLEGADLREANLEGASVKNEQLAFSLSLQGATMPDGSKHP